MNFGRSPARITSGEAGRVAQRERLTLATRDRGTDPPSLVSSAPALSDASLSVHWVAAREKIQ